MPGNDNFQMNDLPLRNQRISNPLAERQATAGESTYSSTMLSTARRRSNGTNSSFATNAQRLAQEEHRIAEKSFWRRVVVNTVLIGLWFLFSISITVVSRDWTNLRAI